MAARSVSAGARPYGRLVSQAPGPCRRRRRAPAATTRQTACLCASASACAPHPIIPGSKQRRSCGQEARLRWVRGDRSTGQRSSGLARSCPRHAGPCRRRGPMEFSKLPRTLRELGRGTDHRQIDGELELYARRGGRSPRGKGSCERSRDPRTARVRPSPLRDRPGSPRNPGNSRSPTVGR